MNQTFRFFYVQSKRIWKILPMQLLVNLAVCACVGILAVLLLKTGILSPDRQKYQIGVVGDMSDSYLGFGIQTLQTIDEARTMVELISMSEEEAREAFRKGELYAYVRIPDGLIDSIESGANDRPVTYVAAEGQKGLGSIVMTEIVDVVSDLITHSQSGIYGMQQILADYGIREETEEAVVQLNYRYFDVVLSRKNLYDLEILGVSDGVSTEGYYFCSILILFLLLFGINNCLFFSRRNGMTARFLAARGIGAAGQVSGEYLAYVCLTMSCVLEIFLLLATAFQVDIFQMAEWKRTAPGFLSVFFLKLWPVIFMIASMQFLIYEFIPDVVSSILMQFLCAVSMGYVSGLFYPAYFFPKAMQKVGEFLPTGVCLRYLNDSLAENSSYGAFMGLLIYVLIFLGLSVFLRRNRIQRG